VEATAVWKLPGLRRQQKVSTILKGIFRKRNAVCEVPVYGAQSCGARSLCK